MIAELRCGWSPGGLHQRVGSSRVQPAGSDPESIRSASDAVFAALGEACSACVLPGILTVRAALREELQSFVDASGLPFATMFGDKSVLDEQQPAYIGTYDGRLMDESVREFVESTGRLRTMNRPKEVNGGNKE
jgi:indolepyruvate decarboxylase